MPTLELIGCMGAGFELVDLDAARARGIAVANGQGTNDDCVADHAFGLVIAALRNFRQLDRLCREGVWRLAVPQPSNVSGKRIGILGPGTIGQKIARRAAAFDMPVGHHNRSPKAGVAHRYFDSLHGLAQWCDVLVCAAPGGKATRHIVNAQVLDALGSQGFLVNIGRGSVVDTDALAAALRESRIAGAGLDVYESVAGPPRSAHRAGQRDPHAPSGRLVPRSGASVLRLFSGKRTGPFFRARGGQPHLSASLRPCPPLRNQVASCRVGLQRRRCQAKTSFMLLFL